MPLPDALRTFQLTRPPSRTPTQPLDPTYGGEKNRFASRAISSSWLTAVDLIQIAGCPFPWPLLALSYMANSLLFSRKVGASQVSTSCTSGKPRQIFRTRDRAEGGMVSLTATVQY